MNDSLLKLELSVHYSQKHNNHSRTTKDEYVSTIKRIATQKSHQGHSTERSTKNTKKMKYVFHFLKRIFSNISYHFNKETLKFNGQKV